jgi:uncharacterized protein (TIGR02996 family)
VIAARIPDEQAALLAAIVAEPDEDAPRLVYADWLQEHGDEEQAACIRESVRVGMLPEGAEKSEAARRVDELIETRAEKWVYALGLLHLTGLDCGSSLWPPQEVAYLSAESFIEDAPTLFTRLPIRGLTVDCQRGEGLETESLTAMAAMPGLSNLQRLALANRHREVPLAGWVALIRSDNLRNLQALAVNVCQLADAHAHALAAGPGLGSLTALDLSENQIGFAGILAVVRSRHLTKVERLSLMNNSVLELLEAAEFDHAQYQELDAALTARFGSRDPLWKAIK